MRRCDTVERRTRKTKEARGGTRAICEAWGLHEQQRENIDYLLHPRTSILRRRLGGHACCGHRNAASCGRFCIAAHKLHHRGDGDDDAVLEALGACAEYTCMQSVCRVHAQRFAESDPPIDGSSCTRLAKVVIAV